MVISLWVHIIGLALLRWVPPLPSVTVPPPLLLEIEVPLPEPEPEAQTASKRTPAGARKPSDKLELPAQSVSPGADPDEETISLESKAPKYFSYLGLVKARIKRSWVFPPAARQKHLAGRLTAVFTLDRSGKLRRVTVERSSGHPLLDQAALAAVQRGAPYPGFPKHIDLERLNVRANFDYRIRYIGVK